VNSPAFQVDFRVRPAQPSDRAALTHLRGALWPESSAEEHSGELASILAGNGPGALPLVILVAEAGDGALVGFLELGLRSHAEGCDPSRPVGYVEGWYVAATHRQRGIGKELLAAAEEWARHQGCVEMASDAVIGNRLSQRVHESLGFSVVERSVHFHKALRRGRPT
jgi:aminoglycoside 6'-N-acetyltransferase I